MIETNKNTEDREMFEHDYYYDERREDEAYHHNARLDFIRELAAEHFDPFLEDEIAALDFCDTLTTNESDPLDDIPY